jgi:hypothetical protein
MRRAADSWKACTRCPNDERNPAVRTLPNGLCETCQHYATSFSVERLADEMDFVKSLIGTGGGAYDAMVGVSGGKDSTAALVRACELGFTPLAFTFDTGYYPEHIPLRAKDVAAVVGVAHEVIDLRPHVRPSDLDAFRLTAELYDEPESPALADRFQRLYLDGRRAFSIRNDAPMPYVRTCQACRRLVVRAYHREATARGVRVVLLGTNEWVGLSQSPSETGYAFSAVRTLHPSADQEPVYVVHLPFLLRTTIMDTTLILDRIGWSRPLGENLIESSANSCLLSRAAEAKAYRMLGFHPDTSRLAREVTAGFLTRDLAVASLAQPHDHPLTVRQVLTHAGIIP